MKKKHIFYFSPHQDDELTNLGVGICRDTSDGHDVHAVLCTDGSASGVKRMLINGETCRWHEGEHHFSLSEEEFIAARDKEFISSCLALGIKKENVLISPLRVKDGSLTTEQAERIMLDALKGYEKSECVIKTISPVHKGRQNPDHTAVGAAAKGLMENGFDARFFYEFILLDEIAGENGFETFFPTKEEKEKITNAAGEYNTWAPEKGRYAVGYHSVADEFDSFLSGTVAVAHKGKTKLD